MTARLVIIFSDESFLGSLKNRSLATVVSHIVWLILIALTSFFFLHISLYLTFTGLRVG